MWGALNATMSILLEGRLVDWWQDRCHIGGLVGGWPIASAGVL